jgi:hypothetical protein
LLGSHYFAKLDALRSHARLVLAAALTQACRGNEPPAAETEVSSGSNTSSSSGVTVDGETSSTTAASSSTSIESSGEPSEDDSGTGGSQDCEAITVREDCEAAGCTVWSGTAYDWSPTAGTCGELGPTFVCGADGVSLATPYYYWRARETGAIDVVLLHGGPSLLESWHACDCSPGSPFACFGCNTGYFCIEGSACSTALDPDSCAAVFSPDAPCRWVPATVYAGEGAGCESLTTGGHCVAALPGKDDCSLADPPRGCDAWSEDAPPYVRTIDGDTEVITWSSCGDLPWGYMPCWSAEVGDPPACQCAC